MKYRYYGICAFCGRRIGMLATTGKLRFHNTEPKSYGHQCPGTHQEPLMEDA